MIALITILVILVSSKGNEIVNGFGSSLIGQVCTYLGKRSYSLYLIHVPIGVYLLNRGRGTESDWGIVFDLLVLVGCVLFAEPFYQLVEHPSHGLSRKVSVGRRQ